MTLPPIPAGVPGAAGSSASVGEEFAETSASAVGWAEPTKKKRASGSLLSVFRFTAAITAVTILLGLLTNKVVVLMTGAQGVAVLALYRSLTATAAAMLSLSMGPVIVQRISLTRSLEEARKVLRAAWMLFVLQVGVLAGVTLLGARPLARLMFKEDAARYVTEVRVVVILVSGVLGLQIATALLNGRVRFREAMMVNLLSSVLTLLAVYPLVMLGDLGLAMVIGLTCFLAAAVGGWFVWREYGLALSDLRMSWQEWRAIRAMPTSLALNVRVVVATATMFALQFLINRTYGITALGFYSAAAMIEGGLMQVLSSAMIPYKLPSLAAMETQAEKNALVNGMLSMLLGISAPAVLALTLAGGLLIPLLFRGDFAPAVRFLPILGVAVLAQCIVWCYAVFLQHKGDFGAYLALDSTWAALLIGSLLLSARQGWSLDTLLWLYACGYCILALLYILYSTRVYSRGLLDRRLGLLVLFLAVSAAAFYVEGRLLFFQLGLVAATGYALYLHRQLVRRQ
jgi:O-antigen/teichoic acid export membrane protein